MDEKKSYPGDKDYKGGIFDTTVRINGQNKEVHVVKDENGNVIFVSETNKILGIF